MVSLTRGVSWGEPKKRVTISEEHKASLASHATEHYKTEIRELEKIVSDREFFDRTEWEPPATTTDAGDTFALTQTVPPPRPQTVPDPPNWRPATGGYSRPLCSTPPHILFASLPLPSAEGGLPRLGKSPSVGSLTSVQVQSTRKRPARTPTVRRDASMESIASMRRSASSSGRRPFAYQKSLTGFEMAEISFLRDEMQHISRLPRVRLRRTSYTPNPARVRAPARKRLHTSRPHAPRPSSRDLTRICMRSHSRRVGRGSYSSARGPTSTLEC